MSPVPSIIINTGNFDEVEEANNNTIPTPTKMAAVPTKMAPKPSSISIASSKMDLSTVDCNMSRNSRIDFGDDFDIAAAIAAEHVEDEVDEIDESELDLPDDLNLRRDYRDAVDCLKHCAVVMKDLENKVTARDREIEEKDEQISTLKANIDRLEAKDELGDAKTIALAAKDKQIASLEEKIVQMSVELASLKALDDINRSNLRNSQEGESPNLRRSAPHALETNTTKPPPPLRAVSCPMEDVPTDAPLAKYRPRRARSVKYDDDENDVKSDCPGKKGRRRSSKTIDNGNNKHRRRRSFGSFAKFLGGKMVDENGEYDEQDEDDQTISSKGSGTASLALDVEFKSTDLDESTSSRISFMSLDLGQLFNLHDEVIKGDDDEETHNGGDGDTNKKIDVDGDVAAGNVGVGMGESASCNGRPGEQQQGRRRPGGRRMQRALQASSRSFLAGVVFPRDFEDVVTKGFDD